MTTDDSTQPRPPPPRPRRLRRFGLGAGLLAGGIVVAFGVCEWQGWPMLRRPAENWASQQLDREVNFAGTGSRWRLHLLGGVSLRVDHLEIGAPSWSTLGSTLTASDVKLDLRYSDLFAFRHGQPLAIESLQADDLALRVQRLSDGRASWQFGKPGEAGAARGKGFDGVQFEQLLVRRGTAIVDDRQSSLSMVTTFELQDGSTGKAKAGIHAQAEGRYRELPLKASLVSGSALPWLSSNPQAPPVDVIFKVDMGQAGLDFEGQVRDLMATQGLRGSYAVRGPSLAAVGQPLGLTLPSTPPFAMQGSLSRDGSRWSTQVRQATIGRSVMMGDFVYDRPAGPGAGTRPKLSGTLRSPVLWLADLGPAIGTSSPATLEGPVSRTGMGPLGANRPAAMAAPKPVRTSTSRVLPDRPFDLPSLRKMDADVGITVDRLESGNERLKAIEPLHAHLMLTDGVLVLDDVDARLAQGRLGGKLSVDGRAAAAQWQAQLTIRGLRLEQWLLDQRGQGKGDAGGRPYVTGNFGGQIDIKGHGRSTAEFLASADGHALLFWTQGTVSHLLVEEAGIDIAQSLGLMVKGDDALPVTCAAADLRASQGMVRPQFMIVDTSDSAIRVDGALSLATERLGLVLRVEPKDFSPLALRTPVDIGGTFGKPEISLEKGPLLTRAVPAALLAAINPLAALLPLIDTGDKAAHAAAQECQELLLQRKRPGL